MEEVKSQRRYAFAEERASKWSVKALCRMLSVSESGYYRYRKNKDKPKRDELLSGGIGKILDKSPYNATTVCGGCSWR